MIYRFANGQRYYSGNKCERFLSNNQYQDKNAFNMFDYKMRCYLSEPIFIMLKLSLMLAFLGC